jgi:hypothetical protein
MEKPSKTKPKIKLKHNNMRNFKNMNIKYTKAKKYINAKIPKVPEIKRF